MTTPKEFRERHNLSEQGFKRLIAKVKAVHPDLYPFTEKVSGRVYRVLHEQILEAHLSNQESNDSTNANNPQPVTAPTNTRLGSALATLSVAVGGSDLAPIDGEIVDTPTYSLAKTDTLTERQQRLTEQQRQLETMRAIVSAANAQLIQQEVATVDVARREAEQRRRLELEAIALDERIKQAEALRIRRQIAEEYRAASEVGNDPASQLEQFAKALRQ